MRRAPKLPRVVAVLVLMAVAAGLTGCEQEPKGADALKVATGVLCAQRVRGARDVGGCDVRRHGDHRQVQGAEGLPRGQRGRVLTGCRR